MSPIVSHHILAVFTFAATLLLISILIRSRRPPANTIAWLIVIALAPYVGIPLFLVFGSRKMIQSSKKRIYPPKSETAAGNLLLDPSSSRVRKVLRSAGAPDPVSNSCFDFLETGEEAYTRLIRAIREAKESIDIAIFIFSRDEVGKEILNELALKSKEGIRVRLLVDSWGSSLLVRPSIRSLIRAGGKVAYFMPLIHLPFRGKTNLRNHRKIALFDQRLAWFGGMNFAKEYLGPEPYARRWQDIAVMIEGGSVSDLSDIFDSDWSFATGHPSPVLEIRKNSEENSRSPHFAQVVASGPDVPDDPLYNLLLESCFESKTRIWIATPYFIPDDSLIKALELACKRGIDVRLLTPRKSNHFFADLSRGTYLSQLADAGGHIHFLESMIHAKMTLIDEEFALIGSANFDLRSLLYNYELGVLAYSPREVRKASSWMEGLMEKTKQDYRKPGVLRDLGEGVGRLFGPLL
jgi:cardiolipin synthase